jgi:hypothetical protein
MVLAPTMPGTGGLFRSPFPTDAAPPATQPADPRAVPSAGGEQRAQRPDLEVDWSHLERERAALAERQPRRESHGGRAGTGPLIGENEVARGDSQRRDDRRGRDDRGRRYDDADEYGDVPDERYRGPRGAGPDRYSAGRSGEPYGDRYAEDDEDDEDDPRDTGYDSGYTDQYSDQYPAPYDQRAAGRPRHGQLPRLDASDAWGAQRDVDPWEATGVYSSEEASVATGEQYWEPGGGRWGAELAASSAADVGARATPGRAPAERGKPARGDKTARIAPAGRARKKGRSRVVWLIGSIVTAMALVLLARYALQHVPRTTGTTNPGLNNAQVFTDGLLSNKNGWLTNTDSVFKADGYHLTRGYPAYAPVADATNFDVSVQVTQTAGTVLAPYGLVFRRISLGNYYVFGIDGNGKWTFYKALDNVDTDIVTFTASPAIRPGLNAQNTLEVKATGTHFTFFVNGTQVGEADDASLAKAGELGVAGHDGIEVVFTAFTLKRLA